MSIIYLRIENNSFNRLVAALLVTSLLNHGMERELLGSSGSSLAIQLLIIIILTLINAVFAASEIAFVSINQSKIEKQAAAGKKSAKRVLTLLEDSDDFLATIQVAITFAGFLSSASAATSFSQIVADWLPSFPGAMQLSTALVTLALSYVSLVFGELFPKQIALQMPDKIAMMTSGLVLFMQKITKPFVWLLSASTNFLQKITPVDFEEETQKFTRDEMSEILNKSHSEGSIDMEEYTMLEGVLSLDTKIAKELMVPRTDTQMVDIDDNLKDNVKEIIDSPFSRIPIYQNEKDNVIGIIHVKNILKYAKTEGFNDIDLLDLANNPLFVPGTMYTDDLLIEFKRQQQHMAILIDEYGGVEGIVTLEDLIEEIVGEIDDESDIQTAGDIRKIDSNNYFVNAGVHIEKFNDFFDLAIETEDIDTLAGAMIRELGYVPTETERVVIRVNDYVMTTTRVQNGRIYSVRVTYDEEQALESQFEIDTERSEQPEESTGE